MRKNRFYILGMLALALAFGAVLAGCSKKDSGGGSSGSGSGGGGSGGGGSKVGKASPATDFTYDLSKDDGGKSVVIEKYTGNGGALVIPAEIEGLPVSTLAYMAFDAGQYGDKPGANITSVVIPASVKFIRGACFSRNENLTSVTILGTGVEIRDGAFSNCINLSELKFPDGDKVLIPGGSDGPRVFSGCKKLPLAVRSKLNEMGFTNI
jgi:hypothetical protein